MSSSLLGQVGMPDDAATEAILKVATKFNDNQFVVVKTQTAGREVIIKSRDMPRIDYGGRRDRVPIPKGHAKHRYFSDELVQVGVDHVLSCQVGYKRFTSENFWAFVRVSSALFFTALTMQNPFSPDPEHRQYANQFQNIERWFCDKPAFHETKAFIFTLHKGDHFSMWLIWRLDRLLDSKCKIYCFDSMEGEIHGTSTHFRVLRHFVMNKYMHSNPLADASKVAQAASGIECIKVKVTKQTNFYDCGPHSVLNFEILIGKVKIALEANR